MKIAIVYDWIDKWGGVERVLLALHEMFPEADYYTSYVDYQSAGWAEDLNIRTSFIAKFPSFIKKNRIFSLPFYPYAFESFDLSAYDVVLSVTSSFAKGIITKPTTKHICYLLTPTRFLWVYPEIYEQNKIITPVSSYFSEKLREWDYLAAQRPDKYVSISKNVANRCQKYYRQSSEVIYPPFDEEYWSSLSSRMHSTVGNDFKPFPTQNYFLVVSRLEPYKKVDLIIDTFNNLPDQNLVIIGQGTQFNLLKSKAGKNIAFLQNISDEELVSLYKNAQALIMPQEEDFGYVAIEAQFLGCPVIAFNKGGAEETLIENKTAVFFKKQSPEALSDAIARFASLSYNLKKSTKTFGVEQSRKFSLIKFKVLMLKVIND
ncbi:MAG: glycosyltransferase [Candidatus Roizmanbacteria bacterium]|nr:MAG: glycosyltransferase [Candidatus Roizmanbacteria bacterium]